MPSLSTVFAFLERRAEEVVAGVCVTVMAVLVFFQVVMRYVFSAPTSWSDEIAVYAMLWSVYISASWAVRERTHIRVMNLINLFPGRMALGLAVLSDLVWFVFAIYLTWQSFLLHLSMWELPFDSPVLGVAQKWPYLCLFVGFALMTVRLIQVYYHWARDGILPTAVPEDGAVLHD